MPRKTKISDEDRCQGIKTDGERCTRRHIDDCIYCKSHKKINEKNNNGKKEEKQLKKRGRKPRIIPDNKIYEPDKYLPVYPCLINGKKLLMDFNFNVFTYDLENPKYLGKKTINGIVK